MNGVTAKKSKENPWKVPNLDIYHIWACPECGYKCQTKSLLVHHAVLQHPQVKSQLFVYICILRKLSFYKAFFTK